MEYCSKIDTVQKYKCCSLSSSQNDTQGKEVWLPNLFVPQQFINLVYHQDVVQRIARPVPSLPSLQWKVRFTTPPNPLQMTTFV